MADGIFTRIEKWFAQRRLERAASSNKAKGFSTVVTDPEELMRRRLGNTASSRKRSNVTGGLSGIPTLGSSFLWAV